MEINENAIGNFNFEKGVVKTGMKTDSDITPTVTLSPTFNVFRLSSSAMALMGVKTGEHVTLYNLKGEEGVVDNSNRFYISKAYIKDDEQIGAKIGVSANFSFGNVYAHMLLNDFSADTVSVKNLIDANLLITKEQTLKNGDVVLAKTALMTVKYEMKSVGKVTMGDNEEEIEIFMLTNAVRKPHTPVTRTAESDEVEDNKFYEDED